MSRLSPRQRECVRLVAQSFTRKEIGAHLGISVKTAEYHITRAAQSLNLCPGDIAAFTRFAIRTKLIKL